MRAAGSGVASKTNQQLVYEGEYGGNEGRAED
jgi:hypothetical protein